MFTQAFKVDKLRDFDIYDYELFSHRGSQKEKIEIAKRRRNKLYSGARELSIKHRRLKVKWAFMQIPVFPFLLFRKIKYLEKIKKEFMHLRKLAIKNKKVAESIYLKAINDLKFEYEHWYETPPDMDWRLQQLLKKTRFCPDCHKELLGQYIIVTSWPLYPDKGTFAVENMQVICSSCESEKQRKRDLEKLRDVFKTVKECHSRRVYLKFKYPSLSFEDEIKIVKVTDVPDKFNSTLDTSFRGFSFKDFSINMYDFNKMSDIQVLNELPNLELSSIDVEKAFKNGKLIHCHYTKYTGGRSMRTLKPIEFTYFRQSLVLTCFDYMTKENRNFNMKRMRQIELVDEPKEQIIISGTV